MDHGWKETTALWVVFVCVWTYTDTSALTDATFTTNTMSSIYWHLEIVKKFDLKWYFMPYQQLKLPALFIKTGSVKRGLIAFLNFQLQLVTTHSVQLSGIEGKSVWWPNFSLVPWSHVTQWTVQCIKLEMQIRRHIWPLIKHKK